MQGLIILCTVINATSARSSMIMIEIAALCAWIEQLMITEEGSWGLFMSK